MIFKLFFCLSVSFALFSAAESTPAGCSCGCRPPPPPPPPSCLPTVPLMLDNCGPNPCPLPPINAPPIQTCTVNKGVVALPACAPPPKTIANTCHCVKTVVKPQVVQQLITVPTIQRYIQTTHQPVVEHIHYQGVPINCPPYVPEAPAPAPPCPPPPSGPAACAPPTAAPKPCLALAALKPALPAPPAIHPSLLALLSLAARSAPPALPPCLPLKPCLPTPPPALPACLRVRACLPTPPPAPAAIPASISIPPCLLSLLSKLL